MRFAKKEGMIIPNIEKKVGEEKFEGATVLEPKIGF